MGKANSGYPSANTELVDIFDRIYADTKGGSRFDSEVEWATALRAWGDSWHTGSGNGNRNLFGQLFPELAAQECSVVSRETLHQIEVVIAGAAALFAARDDPDLRLLGTTANESFHGWLNRMLHLVKRMRADHLAVLLEWLIYLFNAAAKPAAVKWLQANGKAKFAAALGPMHVPLAEMPWGVNSTGHLHILVETPSVKRYTKAMRSDKHAIVPESSSSRVASQQHDATHEEQQVIQAALLDIAGGHVKLTQKDRQNLPRFINGKYVPSATLASSKAYLGNAAGLLASVPSPPELQVDSAPLDMFDSESDAVSDMESYSEDDELVEILPTA